MRKKAIASDLRKLQFANLQAASDEAQSLLQSGYDRCGNWSLAQICRHLRLVQDPSIDGYPRWMSLFAFLRPVMRRTLLPRLMQGNSPIGIPTSPVFVPPAELDDADEVLLFHRSVDRFKSHQGNYAAHPGFGRMDRDALETLHAAHAAHHLRFLKPHPRS